MNRGGRRRRRGAPKRTWVAYLLRCADGTLYAGVTNDIAGRTAAHDGEGRGAKYTRGRGPVEVVWTQRAASRSEAQRLEWRVKGLTRAGKLDLVARRGRIRLPQRDR